MENKVRVAINGFGRIGRLTFRKLLSNKNVTVVAINDLANIEMLAHLLQYDSVHGTYENKVTIADDYLIVDDNKIQISNESDPEQLAWKSLSIDMVIESTGRFVSEEGAQKHLSAGAKKVIISAPAKGTIKTVVLGVNEQILTSDDRIISNASCTTNCLAPLVKVLDQEFGIKKGYLSTVHAYTADQKLQDAPHKDFRRSRAAALSIIPTSTGAAAAVGKVIPHLKGKLDGIALRVPVPNGSLTDFTAIVNQTTTKEEVNKVLEAAAKGELNGIMDFVEAPLVSTDIIGNPHSSIIDAPLTAVNGDLIKVVAWYDNEFGYASRTADLVNYVSNLSE